MRAGSGIGLSLGVVLALLMGEKVAAGQTPKIPPNVIVMMADDMGLGDTSAYLDVNGNTPDTQVLTPNMERLARMGIRMTDAHTPCSRCTTTRYGLMTGRYSWRNRLKFWVLFGVQGDPMIERDRPTLATLFRDEGYRTGMFGKWHIGLRYRQNADLPAAGWDDADLRFPLFDSPADHGFDECKYTSRSHGTSGPTPAKNTPDQTGGPGHIDGRKVIGATDNGKQLVASGPNAYILDELGSRHSDDAVDFMNRHLTDQSTNQSPFFLYYPANSNHTPYTPDTEIGGQPVKGHGKSVSGKPMNVRSDFVYENDVALGRLLDYLSENQDPRRPGHRLIENTLVIFTSDNGADRQEKTATGPWRSNKGSCYEGGHRVPFLAACPAAGIGDGDDQTPGQSSDELISLTDLMATFAELISADLPDPRQGEKGAEDSHSVLAALRGEKLPSRAYFFNDHRQAKDPAVCAMRLDNPIVNGQELPGEWKIFFDANLVRFGIPRPFELYNLTSDPYEKNDLINDPQLKPLIAHLSAVAEQHRNSGGHRLADLVSDKRVVYSWAKPAEAPESTDTTVIDLRELFETKAASKIEVEHNGLTATFEAVPAEDSSEGRFSVNPRGVGITGGKVNQVDAGEAVLVTFNQDVVVESAGIVAGNGTCGGFYRVGEGAPLAIYCIDADIDDRDHNGNLSDIGVVPAGTPLRFDSHPHYGVEDPGQWRLQSLNVRLLK